MIYFNFKFNILCLLIIVMNDCVSKIVDQNNLQLKFVFILSRHMNRAPLIEYKNNTNHINWPRGLGQLTDQGIWNAYRAGQALRERYLGFLHPLQRYTPSEIDVSSTSVERCYQTAGYLLAGMYPPNDEQTWNQELRWQPIPIKTSLSKDYQQFAENPSICPKYSVGLHIATETLINTEKYKNLVEYMKNYTSFTLDTSDDVYNVADAIWTEVATLHMANYTIPDWAMERKDDTDKYILSNIDTLVETEQMKRLFSGDMLNDILTRMEASMNKSPDAKKMYLHIGHDSSIVPLLKTLNIENVTYPLYGAAVVMELHATPSNETVVKLLYNKDYKWKESDIKLIELPGCPQPCRLDDWRSYTKKMIPSNISEECKN